MLTQQARSSRPPSTVKSLLETHGLQNFSDILLTNGYDDLHFLAEVSEAELQEIGIKQLADREKVSSKYCIPTCCTHLPNDLFCVCFCSFSRYLITTLIITEVHHLLSVALGNNMLAPTLSGCHLTSDLFPSSSHALV